MILCLISCAPSLLGKEVSTKRKSNFKQWIHTGTADLIYTGYSVSSLVMEP